MSQSQQGRTALITAKFNVLSPWATLSRDMDFETITSVCLCMCIISGCCVYSRTGSWQKQTDFILHIHVNTGYLMDLVIYVLFCFVLANFLLQYLLPHTGDFSHFLYCGFHNSDSGTSSSSLSKNIMTCLCCGLLDPTSCHILVDKKKNPTPNILISILNNEAI